MRYLTRPRFAWTRLDLRCHVDGFLPFFFGLVDLEEETAGLRAQRALAQPVEDFLGPVKDAGLEIVLAKLEQRGKPLLGRQVRSIDQVLVHADGAIVFAAPP